VAFPSSEMRHTLHSFRFVSALPVLLAKTLLPSSSAFFPIPRVYCISTVRKEMSVDASGRTIENLVDKEYPGTAVARMQAVRDRVKSLTRDNLDGPWEEVRRKLLWAGGLRDLASAVPGQGYTGHSFNDWNHVDLTTMVDQMKENLNDGEVKGIAVGNCLGPGIRTASLPELGPGGSWSTCAIGCNSEPPRDVAHVQFRSRIAFKLVWVPVPGYNIFVLVDDSGKLLAKGSPTGSLPNRRERLMNYEIVKGSKYAVAADTIAEAVQNEI